MTFTTYHTFNNPQDALYQIAKDFKLSSDARDARDAREFLKEQLECVDSNAEEVDDYIKRLEERVDQRDLTIDGLECDLQEAKDTIDKLTEELAASQAREQQLRDVLEKIESGEADNGCILSLGGCVDIAREALAIPHDTSALRRRKADQ